MQAPVKKEETSTSPNGTRKFALGEGLVELEDTAEIFEAILLVSAHQTSFDERVDHRSKVFRALDFPVRKDDWSEESVLADREVSESKAQLLP